MANGPDVPMTPEEKADHNARVALLKEQQAALKELGTSLDAVRESMKLEKDEIDALNKRNKERIKLLDKQAKLQALGKNLSNDELELLKERTSETKEFDRQLRIANEARRTEIDLKREALDLTSQLTGLQLDQIGSLKGLTTQIIQMAHSLDAANVALAQATGYTEAFSGDITALAGETHGLGMTLEELGSTVSGVGSSMTLFATYSGTARLEIGVLAAEFSKMGIEAGETGLLLDGLTRGMNMTRGAAVRAAKDFDRLGQQIGLPTSQMVKDFQTLQPQLARYGDEGTKVFKKLATQARALGMELQEAFNIAEAFDTFQGAADLAGKLNAQIGLQLNSVEMMTASHEDRIKILRQEFDLRGKNFKDMDRRQKQAIADVLGVDVDLASRLFGDPAKMRLYNKEQKELRERAEKMTKAMDKFKVLLQEIVIEMTPVVEIIMGFVKFLAESGIAKVLVFVAAMKGILTVLFSLSTVLPVVGTWFASLATTLGFVAPTMPGFLTSIGAGLSAFFNFMKTISPADIAKGAGALVLLAFSLGALGLSLGSFKEIGLNELATATGAIVLLGLAILGLGAIMYSGIGAIVFAAGIAALLGLSIALAALGAALGVIASALGGKTSGIAGSLDIIASAMARLGSSEVLGGIKSFIAELGDLASAFKEFDTASESMASLERIVTVSTTMGTGELENMKAVMREVQATFNASNAADKVAMRNAATATANAGQGRSGGQTVQRMKQPIQLVVNDRVFGETVVDIYDEATNPLNIS
jgi:hypothetical protein